MLNWRLTIRVLRWNIVFHQAGKHRPLLLAWRVLFCAFTFFFPFYICPLRSYKRDLCAVAQLAFERTNRARRVRSGYACCSLSKLRRQKLCHVTNDIDSQLVHAQKYELNWIAITSWITVHHGLNPSNHTFLDIDFNLYASINLKFQHPNNIQHIELLDISLFKFPSCLRLWFSTRWPNLKT